MFDSWLSFLYALSQCQICIALNSTKSSPLSSRGREMNATCRNPLDLNVQKVSWVKYMLQGRVVSFIWCITTLSTAQWSQEGGFLSNNALYWTVYWTATSSTLPDARGYLWLFPWQGHEEQEYIGETASLPAVVPRFKQLVVTPRVIL